MARPIHLPPKDLGNRVIRQSTVAAGSWWKVHLATRDAARFSANPAHRFSPPNEGFEVLYLAADVTTCLWEVFGDELFSGNRALSSSAWMSRTATQVTVPRSKACNLDSVSVRAAVGGDLSAFMHTDLAIPQAWAKSIQCHPAGFAAIVYASRFTGKRCLASLAPPSKQADFKATEGIPLSAHPEALGFLADNRIALV